MSRPCDACPCGEICLRWPAFCMWAAEQPPDPVKIAHIRARSGMPARPPEYPSLARQAVNLAGSFWSWAVSGFSMATEDEQARRLAICSTCMYFDVSQRRCKQLGCGCYLDVKVKLKTEKCPIKKW